MGTIEWILRAFLDSMGAGAGSILGFSLSDVLKTPAEYSPQAHALMQDISTTAVVPIAASLLIVLFLLEALRHLTKADADGDLILTGMLWLLVKYAVLRYAFEHVDLIITTIYDAVAYMSLQANRLTITASTATPSQVDAFISAVGDMDMLGQTVLVIVMLIAWIVNHGAVIVALALVVMRFMTLYLFSAFAPIPIAFFANEDTRHMGIGYLRNYASVALQAFVLVIGWALFHSITTGWNTLMFSNLDGMASGIAAALGIGSGYILLGVLLAMFMLGMGRIADRMLGN